MHYPFETDHDFAVNQILIDYEYDDVKKLTFSLKFDGGECGEMGISLPSLPHQVLERNADLIAALSDSTLEQWDLFFESLPKQLGLPLPELHGLETSETFSREELESIQIKKQL
jgi:hypothetical protein